MIILVNKIIQFYKLFDISEKKTTNQIIVLLVIGFCIPIIFSLFENWSLLIIAIQTIDKIDFSNVQSSRPLFYFFALLIFFAILLAFVRRRKFAWIFLNFLFSYGLGTLYVYILLAFIWSIKTVLLNQFILFKLFNYHEFIWSVLELLWGVGIIFFMNKRIILNAFKLKLYHQYISFGLTVAFLGVWIVLDLSDSFNNEDGPRKYLPKEFYSTFDIPLNKYGNYPIKSESEKVVKLFNKGINLYLSNDYQKAIYYFELALNLEPHNIYVLESLANAHARNNEIRIGISYYDKAIEIDSTRFGFYNDRGLMHYKLRENSEALKNYYKALQIDSTNSAVYINLALVYFYIGEKEKSFESIKKAEDLGGNPKDMKTVKEIINFID